MTRQTLMECFCLLAVLNMAQAGQLVVGGPDQVDFGEYHASERRSATFRLKNEGLTPVSISRVRKTCGCAAIVTGVTNVLPGEETTLEVAILPHSITGTYTKHTYVETSNHADSFVRVTVSGRAVPLVSILPQESVFAGRMPTNRSLVQVFELLPSDPATVLGSPVATNSRPSRVDLSPVGEGRQQLCIEMAPTDLSGDYVCTVKIPFLSPSNHPPLSVSLTARIGAELTIVPGITYLPVSAEPTIRRFELQVLGQRSRMLLPEETTFPTNHDAAFRVVGSNHPGRLLLEGTFSPEFTRELFAQENIPLQFSVRGAASTKLVCRTKQ